MSEQYLGVWPTEAAVCTNPNGHKWIKLFDDDERHVGWECEHCHDMRYVDDN